MPAIVTRSIKVARTLVATTDQTDDLKRAAHKRERHRVRDILSQHWIDPYVAEEEIDRTFRPRLTGWDIV